VLSAADADAGAGARKRTATNSAVDQGPRPQPTPACHLIPSGPQAVIQVGPCPRSAIGRASAMSGDAVAGNVGAV
jgi:hypothetical protein